MRKTTSKISVNTNELEVIEEANSMMNTMRNQEKTYNKVGRD